MSTLRFGYSDFSLVSFNYPSKTGDSAMPGVKGYAALVISIVVGACGGGPSGSANNGGGPGTVATTAEGAYAGTLSVPGRSELNAFDAVVLEDGASWTVYGAQSAKGLSIKGFVQGAGTSNNGSYSSSSALDFGNTPPAASAILATYVGGSTLAGTMTVGGKSSTFSGSLAPYDYTKSAQLSKVVGLWNLANSTSDITTLVISATGSVNGVVSSGCNFSGSISPRSSGKNVFTMSVTYGSTACEFSNQNFSGIATFGPLVSNGADQFVFTLVNASRSSGTFAYSLP